MKRIHHSIKFALIVLLAVGIHSLLSISQMKPVAAAGGYVVFEYPGDGGELMGGSSRPFYHKCRFRAYPLPGYELKEMRWEVKVGSSTLASGTATTNPGYTSYLPIYAGVTYTLKVTGVFFKFPNYNTEYTVNHEWTFYGVERLSQF